MDSNIRERVHSKLTTLAGLGDWIDNFNDPTTAIEYIEGNVTCLANIWNNIANNLDKVRVVTRKSMEASIVAYRKALVKFIELGQKEKLNDQKRSSKLMKVLALIDKAITNCPFDKSHIYMAQLFCLRSMALFEIDQTELALVAIDRALSLSPDSIQYNAYKSRYLSQLGHHYDAYRLIKRFLRTAHYPRATEEEGSIDAFSLDMLKNLYLDIQQRIKPERRINSDDLINLNEEEEDYEDCALESNYDSETDDCGDDFANEVLAEREQKAQDKYANPYEDSSKNYSIDYRCALHFNNQKGRYLSTVENIAKRTLIFRERAYSMIILPNMRLKNCHFCGRDVSNRFWPCRTCNQMVYCAEQCAALDWKLSHRYDCGLTDYWNNKSKSTFHVFRLVNRLGVEGILEVLGEGQRQSLEGSQYDLFAYRDDQAQRFTKEENKDSILQRKVYLAQMALLSHSDDYSGDHLSYNMSNAIDCAIMACLAQGYEFNQISRAQLVLLISHCFVQIRRVLTNVFRWTAYNHEEDTHIATCFYLLGSLFNHSCNPNSEWTISEGNIHLTTIKTIKADEEITISYGPNIESAYFENRQKHLSEGYFFQCNCSACVDESRLMFALQCSACPGPVLLNPFDGNKDSHCLVCFVNYPQTKKKMDLLVQTCQVLFANVHNCLTSFDKNKEISLTLLKESIKQIQSMIYGPSVIMVELIYLVCQLYHRENLLNECIEFGCLVDSTLPLKGSDIALPDVFMFRQKDEIPFSAAYYSSNAISLNIEHMLFWTSIYRTWIEQTGSGDETIWTEMFRFYIRLQRLINWAIEYKEGKLAELQEKKKDTFDIRVLKGEMDVLSELQLGKEQEIERLKRKYGQQVNFDQIVV